MEQNFQNSSLEEKAALIKRWEAEWSKAKSRRLLIAW